MYYSPLNKPCKQIAYIYMDFTYMVCCNNKPISSHVHIF